MKNEHQNQIVIPLNIIVRRRVHFEPELAEIANDWPPLKCLEMSRKMHRFGRQLYLFGVIYIRDTRILAQLPPPELRPICERRQRLN